MQVMHRCEQTGGAACVTIHPGFEPVALNPYVLQAVYGTCLQLSGKMEEPAPNRSVLGNQSQFIQGIVFRVF